MDEKQRDEGDRSVRVEQERHAALRQRLASARYGEGFGPAFSSWIVKFAADLAKQHGVDVLAIRIDGSQSIEVKEDKHTQLAQPCGEGRVRGECWQFPDRTQAHVTEFVPACQLPLAASCATSALSGGQDLWGLQLGARRWDFFKTTVWCSMLRFEDSNPEAAIHHFDGSVGYEQVPPGHSLVRVLRPLASMSQRSLKEAGLNCGHTHGSGTECMWNRSMWRSESAKVLFAPGKPGALSAFLTATLSGGDPPRAFDYLQTVTAQRVRLADAQRAASNEALQRAEHERIADAARARRERRQRNRALFDKVPKGLAVSAGALAFVLAPASATGAPRIVSRLLLGGVFAIGGFIIGDVIERVGRFLNK